MSKRVLLTVVFMSIVLGIVIGYVRGVPDDFVDESSQSVITH